MSDLTGSAAEIADVIGVAQTLRLLSVRGGTQITIPRTPSGSQLADMLGDADTAKLIAALGHGKFSLPNGPERGVAGRRARAKAMLAQGKSLREVALACDLNMRTVTNYRTQMQPDDHQLELPFDRS